ncbi:MAG: DUF4102 domain-containing protein [Chloroflexi bacterium]|nr:DUF4102 domain-containing protein [Chloroflexota bacterium]
MSEQAHGTVTGAITDAVVDALAPGRDRVIWDRALTGFGVRVYPSGARVYVVQTRGPGGTRRATLGRHGVIGAAEARRRAAIAIARARAGEDPAQPRVQKPTGPALATLAERYLREHVAVRCKPSTAAQYRLAIERHILPALGHLPVVAIGRRDVADLQHTLRDRPAMANLVVATLSRLIWRPRAASPLTPQPPSASSCSRAAAATRSSPCAGRTCTWAPVSCTCATARPARARSPSRPRPPTCWPPSPAWRPTPGSSPARRPARGSPASSSPGRACAPAPASRTCASTTSATAMPRAPSHSARASPSSQSSSDTPRSRQQPGTRTSQETPSKTPQSESPTT